MSTNHPYDPNHNDLPPERGADAQETDADALDALLNEIAQGTRHTTARHGEGHHQPKGRSQASDAQADDLPAFARAFHQRVERSDAADPGGTALDPTLWEQIMTRTSPTQSAAAIAPHHPGSLNTRLPERNHTANHPRFRPLPLRGEMLANATLALLLILTAFSAWTVYDRVLAPPPSTPESTVQGLAMQPSTPEATESDAQLEAPPVVTTPEPAFACDFTRDMPIFQQIDESPIDGTALLVTTTSELVLSCPEEPEPVVLATNVAQAGALTWPGAITTYPPFVDGELPNPTLVNVFTGETATIELNPNESSTRSYDHGGSPWSLIGSNSPIPGDTTILDLRTMESAGLSSFFEESTFPPGIATISSTNPSGVLAIGAQTQHDIEGNGKLYSEAGWPGSILIVNGSLNNAHWIDIPADLENIRHILLSPDGQYLSLRANDGDMGIGGSTIYSIVRTSNGEEVARSEPGNVLDPTLTSAWVQDGAALAFIQNNALNLLTVDGESTVLLETDGDFSSLRNTYDPDVITVQRGQEESVATETPDQYQPLMYSINTATGDVIEIQGVDVRDMYGWEQPPSVYLVVSDEWAPQGPTTYRVLDAVTGEEYGSIEDAALAELGGTTGWGRRSFTTAADGSVEVVAFNTSQLYLIHPTIEGPEVVQFASPPGLAESINGTANIFLSPDGSMLSFSINGDESRTRWLLSLTGDNDAWVEVPNTVPGSDPGYILFVPGTGAKG